MYKLFKTYTTSQLKQPAQAFVCFLYIHTMYKLHKMYKNVTRVIYAADDACFLYIQNLYNHYFSNFRMNNDPTMPYSVLFHNFVNFQDQSFHIQGTQINLYCGFI